MTPHDVFIATTDPALVVRQVIAAALGAAIEPSRDAEPIPAMALGPTQVFFHESHPFEDDVDLPVTQYQYWVSVHDTGRDEERQRAVAQRVFDAIKATGRPVLLSHGLQGAIATHP